MRRKLIIEKIMNTVELTDGPSFHENAAGCEKFNPLAFDEYWEETLPDGYRHQLESHCLDCLGCLIGLARAKNNHEKTLLIESRIDQRILLKNSWRSFREARSDVYDEQGFSLMAAAQISAEVASQNTKGTWGIAVDEETGSGDLIRINASVGAVGSGNGIPQINAIVIASRKKQDIEYTRTPILEVLGAKLGRRFKEVPCLKALRLSERDIYVEIDSTEDLLKVGSLMLAVIIAIIKGLKLIAKNDRFVYSAEMGLDGSLEPVGQIPTKAAVVAKHPGTFMVISENAFNAVAEDVRNQYDHLLRPFASLDALLEALAYSPVDTIMERSVSDSYIPPDLLEDEETQSSGGNAPPDDTGAEYLSMELDPWGFDFGIWGPWRIPIIILSFCMLSLYGWLVWLSGRVFFISDMMIAWHLSHLNSDIFRWAQSFKFSITIGVAAWVSGILSARLMRRAIVPQFLGLLAVLCLASNLHVFIRDFYIYPENHQKYVRVKELRTKPVFWSFAFIRNLDHLDSDHVKDYLTSPEVGNRRSGVKIAMKMDPGHPEFNEIFLGAAKALMSGVNDAGTAEKLLIGYFAYTVLIVNDPNSRGLVADTIGVTRNLMEYYDLGMTTVEEIPPYKATRIGGILNEIRRGFGVNP